MGTDKALLEVDGRTLLERLLLVLAPRYERLLVSRSAGPPLAGQLQVLERVERHLSRGLERIEDGVAGLGPLAGIVAGLEHVATRGPGILQCLPVDTAGISWRLVEAQWSAVLAPGGATGAVPATPAGLEPAHGVYSSSLLPAARELLATGRRSLQALAQLPGVSRVAVEPLEAARAFLPLNSREDFEAWQGRKEPFEL